MKERPLIMSAPMVRAILDGKKTQTRRVVKPQPPPFVQQTPDKHPPKHPEPYIDAYCGERKAPENPRGMGVEWCWWTRDDRPGLPFGRCPYGQPGDRLWVREAFFDHGNFEDGEAIARDERIEYRAEEWDRVDPTDAGPWSPSIHMPRWASRVTLELTDVRVQRVHEITEEDAGAEGCLGGHDSIPGYGFSASPLEHFTHLWDKLNAKRGFGWGVNPWVWALTFKRAERAT